MNRIYLLLAAVLCGLFITAIDSNKATALSGSQFQAGRIIDDGIFFNGNTLSTGQIQQFLNAKVPVCDTWHPRSSNPRDTGPPYTCLKDYVVNTPSVPGDSYCNGFSGGTKSAAQIIHEIGVSCGVSQKVILVTLQKEQSFITDTWPRNIEYEKAMGYGCPDTALSIAVDANQNGCFDETEGFFNQVYYGTRQFKRYIADAHIFTQYRPYRHNYIQYHPNGGCGGTNLFVQTQATSALYIYTPYQPNAAALNNLYGTGDGCSAYGNRNFWRLYNEWFGASTTDSNTHALNFIRLNHGSGNAESIGYTSIGSYQFPSTNTFSAYPAVPADGAVVPLFKPNGDLSFIRLNHASGKTEIVSYSALSGYKQVTENRLTGYPAVALDGAVVPLFWPNGDLVFLRLNHSSGKVELVSYSASSGYQNVVNHTLAGYPAVALDGAVVPLFWPNGDLVFLRLNHSSGRTELVSYNVGSNYRNVINYTLTGYPAVAPDGAVVPLFQPNGNLSFVRLNHSSGRTELVSYNVGSNYGNVIDQTLTGYPAVAPDGAVVPLFTR